MKLPRLAIVCDYREENWPSMDLAGEMLSDELLKGYADTLLPERVCPPFRRRFARVPTVNGQRFNADRLLNRFYDYPRALRRMRGRFDLFHIIDHSYSHLSHYLPPERTVITCHDLDTFRSLFNGGEARRHSFLFRGMTRRIMSGLGKAARVACVSAATRDELLAYELVRPERALVIPNGVHPSCSSEPDRRADEEAAKLLGQAQDASDVCLLHVGSTIPRKRIDVLLRVFAALRKEFAGARLVRVGGPFTNGQSRLAEQLDINKAILVLPYLERDVLAAVYRRAAILLQPSEREGFGLPVVEAMACGTPVVASDLPALREVGGEAAVYCPAGNVSAWTETLVQLLGERRERPEAWARRRAAAIAQSSGFSWAAYAEKMVALYRQIL